MYWGQEKQKERNDFKIFFNKIKRQDDKESYVRRKSIER